MIRRATASAFSLIVLLALPGDYAWAQATGPAAQAQDATAPKPGWANSTDLSLVITSGNSASKTFGLVDRLRYVWPNARFSFDVNLFRSDTSDDRYFIVDPGLEFPIGSRPSTVPYSLVTPEPSPDVENYVVGGRYDKDITKTFFWNAGASWDRNKDAGIIRRYITFAGVGHKWADTTRRRFTTNYGVSYTDRKEEKPDPEKEPRFGGARLGWDYMEKLGGTTTIDSDFAANINLADAGDYSINTTNGVSVMMNNHLSLKASLQWLFENQPALEDDLDVVAFGEIINPDGIPGSGDERFRTLPAGGVKLVLGTADARKVSLDTIVRTALVVTF